MNRHDLRVLKMLLDKIEETDQTLLPSVQEEQLKEALDLINELTPTIKD